MNCHPARWADVLIKSVHARACCSITRLVFLHGSGLMRLKLLAWTRGHVECDWACGGAADGVRYPERHLRTSDMTFSGRKSIWNRARRVTEWADTHNDRNKHDANHHKQEQCYFSLCWFKMNKTQTKLPDQIAFSWIGTKWVLISIQYIQYSDCQNIILCDFNVGYCQLGLNDILF